MRYPFLSLYLTTAFLVIVDSANNGVAQTESTVVLETTEDTIDVRIQAHFLGTTDTGMTAGERQVAEQCLTRSFDKTHAQGASVFVAPWMLPMLSPLTDADIITVPLIDFNTVPMTSVKQELQEEALALFDLGLYFEGQVHKVANEEPTDPIENGPSVGATWAADDDYSLWELNRVNSRGSTLTYEQACTICPVQDISFTEAELVMLSKHKQWEKGFCSCLNQQTLPTFHDTSSDNTDIGGCRIQVQPAHVSGENEQDETDMSGFHMDLRVTMNSGMQDTSARMTNAEREITRICLMEAFHDSHGPTAETLVDPSKDVVWNLLRAWITDEAHSLTSGSLVETVLEWHGVAATEPEGMCGLACGDGLPYEHKGEEVYACPLCPPGAEAAYQLTQAQVDTLVKHREWEDEYCACLVDSSGSDMPLLQNASQCRILVQPMGDDE